ncbi:MAG: cytochrome b5-like heme/steroid binding domain-containing protein [Minisyncoccia bacterium]
MFNYIVGLLVALLGTSAVVAVQSDTFKGRTAERETTQLERSRETPVLAEDDDSIDSIERDLDALDLSAEYEITPTTTQPTRKNENSRVSRHVSDDDDDEYEEEHEDEDDEDEEWDDDSRRGQPQITRSNATKPPVSTTPPVQTTKATQITVAELAKHSIANDCWIAFQGDVYNITPIISWHPGGQGAIIPYCGSADKFEQAFTGQHGSKQIGNLVRRAFSKGTLAR